MHLSLEAEFDSEHFQFLTYHCIEKLGIFIEEKFLSEPKIGLLSSSKSNFRDQDQIFWLGRTPRESNPNFPLNQKTNTAEAQLQIQFQHIKLVKPKSFVFPFEVLIQDISSHQD